MIRLVEREGVTDVRIELGHPHGLLTGFLDGKPIKLTEHNADMMRHAIRKHRMAVDADPA